jgi:type II secretory ATPase GspE/PulE/Tfp pilus assembly ATPase PilB-like protein
MGNNNIRFYRAAGCDQCKGTGYHGRVGLYECLIATDTIKKSIIRRDTAESIRQVAMKEGMVTLIQDGFSKVLEGVTDFEQVERVCIR